MDSQINILTLLSLIVAVIVIFKLRSVLGRRTPDDEARIDKNMRAQQAQDQAAAAAAARDKVVAMPRRAGETTAAPVATETALADAEARVKEFAGGNVAIERGLVQVMRADATFDPKGFLEGAKQAYEMIVTAFAEGNRKVLKDLLSKEVFEGFVEAIADRETRAEQIDQSFVGINKSGIVEAEVKGGVAQLTVRFVSQLISATRDKTGAVISGDPQRIKEVTDIWTFAREVDSRNPNWRLVATQPQN
ncbi:MAG: Tim44/TimA family putative adaptor protein [Hyphomicrobiaceae bacterium]